MMLVAATFILVGIGFAFFSSPNSNAIMGAVEPKFYGVASSILSVMRIGGQSISMSVVTMLLALYTVPHLDPAYLEVIKFPRGFESPFCAGLARGFGYFTRIAVTTIELAPPYRVPGFIAPFNLSAHISSCFLISSRTRSAPIRPKELPSWFGPMRDMYSNEDIPRGAQ